MAGKGGEHKPVAESHGEKLALVVGGGAITGMFVFGTTVFKAMVDASTGGAGAALVALGWLAASLGLTGVVVLFFRYLSAIKGATAPVGSPQRRHYQALRDSIQHGGSTELRYARWLTRLLVAVDGFFGDAGRPAPAWQQRCFGRHDGMAVAPLWSAPAYDRCLLLALIYPIAVLLLGWAVSNHVGLAEAALGFKPVAEAWKRATAVVSILTMVVAVYKARRTTGRSSALWLLFSLAAVAVAVMWLSTRSQRRGWQAMFNVGFSLCLGLVCLAAPLGLAGNAAWDLTGPLLLFFGLLTLINAPFDWLSLGLTRGLLRLGLARRGAWPWWLALLDAFLATVLVGLLSAAMVLGIQAFDAMAVRGGGQAVLPLHTLLADMQARPAEPEFWWIYALLLSTLLPSAANAVVGCTSWLRSWPWLNDRLLRQMPDRVGHKAETLVYRRISVAAWLTAQLAVGTLMGLLALGLWVWALLGGLMPWAGLNLLDSMRWLVDQHWPQRLIAAWA